MVKCFAISISAGTISTRHRSAKSPRRPLTLTSLDGGFGGRTRDNYLKKGDYFGCKEQHMHRLAWSYTLPKEGEGQSGIDAKTSIKAASSLARPRWIVKSDCHFVLASNR